MLTESDAPVDVEVWEMEDLVAVAHDRLLVCVFVLLVSSTWVEIFAVRICEAINESKQV